MWLVINHTLNSRLFLPGFRSLYSQAYGIVIGMSYIAIFTINYYHSEMPQFGMSVVLNMFCVHVSQEEQC